ncbi:MAG: PAS domain S-box protein [Anaerolineales bacterium]|nr:PAS domain S-box protein [Anaerolineales bacterium]
MVHAAASLVTNTAGEPLLITSSFIDLTEIHRAQSALAVSERRYRRIVETAQEGVWMIDADSRTTFANCKMGEILGRQPDEMLGMHLFEFMDEDGRKIAEDNLERRRQGISEQHEFKFQRKDGAFVWALLGTNPIHDDNGAYCGALAMVTDITERKRTEAALAHYATELEQSNQDLEQFAYVASHDLQEPLRMVASYVQLLARQYQGKLDAEADQYIGYAVDGAKRMQRLIQDLLTLSRISTRPQTMRNIDCETVLAEALKNLQIVIEDSGASLTHAPLPVVYADQGQLVQLFQNLIGNALKFHGDTPPQVHIEAELEPGDGAVEPPHWLFRISDNGIGIDPQYFDRIFEIFQRLHNRDEYSGTGIGLAICRRIVERHGGHIGVISTPGHGATFFFTLPVNVTNALNDCDSDRRG